MASSAVNQQLDTDRHLDPVDERHMSATGQALDGALQPMEHSGRNGHPRTDGLSLATANRSPE